MKDLAARELAAIDAIETAIAAEKRPDYSTLLRAAKEGHQTAYGQLTSLSRLEGERVATSAGLAGRLATFQTRLTQLIGRTVTLHAMRAVEDHLVESYDELAKEASGLRRDVFAKLAKHGRARSIILTAHIVHTKSDAGPHERLPLPLSAYFAHDDTRACMRCLVDRPGSHPAITRTDPATYVCSGCHDDARAAFPPEIIALIDTWPEPVRSARIVEKALGKPSKETAKKRVHTALAGQPPDERAPVRKKIPVARGALSAPLPLQTTTTLALDEASAHERAYSEHLFDPTRMRRSW